MSEPKKLKLSPPPEAEETDEDATLGESHSAQDSVANKEPQEPASEPESINDVPLKRKSKQPKSKDQASSMVSTSQEKESPEIVTQDTFSIIVEPMGELDEEIAALYFQNKNRSGGGPIKSCIRDGEQILITFETKEDAQDVLKRKNHSINKMAIQVRLYQPQAPDQLQMLSSRVLLENVDENVQQWILTLLIENVSGLSEEDLEFSVEMIPERYVAVITFFKPIDREKFIDAFNQYHRVQQLNVSARSLEMTKSILVERLPSSTTQDEIVHYFESEKFGGGKLSHISFDCEENSAIVTYQDLKDVIAVLSQKHTLNQAQLTVSPYYTFLDTALYGKQRPAFMPNPIKIRLDPHLWLFLHQNQSCINEINDEMFRSCFSELEWPVDAGLLPEVIVHPSHDLYKQKRSVVRAWKKDVSTQFAHFLSKWKAVKCDVNAEIWLAIKNNLEESEVMILPDIPMGKLTLVGEADVTLRAAQDMKLLIENTSKKIEREKGVIEEGVMVSSWKYAILSNAGLQDSISLECPNLKMGYNTCKGIVTLRGIATEVFKIKSIILERLTSMVQKPVDVHPYIHCFLNSVNDETLSQLLFSAKRINALYSLMQYGVRLTAVGPKDLLEAEEVLKKDLIYKCIEVVDSSVIQKKEWRELVDSLCNAPNYSSDTVMIDVQKDQVIIAGYCKDVASTHQKLSEFVDNNTYVQKTIRTKSAAVTMYVEKEKCQSWFDLIQQGVTINFGTQTRRKVIALAGPRSAVLKGVELFQNILSSLCANFVLIDKPGAREFFKGQEHLYVAGALQQYHCLLRMQDSTDEKEAIMTEVDDFPEEMGPPRCMIKLKDGIVITVHKGDLTRCQVDVVVNAANEELKHIGGLAEALLKAAGPQLQRECNDLVRKYGIVRPGCAVISSSWNLPCKQLIHAVGPRWNNSEKERCTQLLKNAVSGSLQIADSYNHQSIAIPAISSGIFGFPLKECAHAIATSVKETLTEFVGLRSLKQICLMDTREETVVALAEAFSKVFEDTESLSRTKDVKRFRHFPPEEHEEVTTPEGLKIILKKKKIEDSTTDAIVNSIASDLKLERGKISKALLNKAGVALQEELTAQGQGKDLEQGCVLQTNGYALACTYVMHAVILSREPSPSQTSQKKLLAGTIEKCLKMAEDQCLNSITFPALRTASVKAHKPFVSKLMIDEVFKFSRTGAKFPQEVHFVLHPSDIATIKVFTNELKKRPNFTSVTFTEASDLGFINSISTSACGAHKMQIGSIELLVECGDITKEATDAIVNITNESFNLKEGVSKAIVDRAGPWIELECQNLASRRHNNLICTSGGNLKCKNIIHLPFSDNIKEQVFKVLRECEQQHFSSVAFPAIGTGKANRNPAEAADDMIDAIVQFAVQTPTPEVSCIKIVVFQPHLEAVFYASMKKKEAEPGTSVHLSRSIFSKIADFFTFRKAAEESKPAMELKTELLLESAAEPVIFQICGDSQESVKNTESWLKTMIAKNQDEITITDEWISAFKEKEYETLKELQQKYYVVIKIASTGSLRILGVTKDVLGVSLEIQEMLRKIRNSHEELAKADLFCNIVEWRYEEKEIYKPFGKLANMQIEFAFQQQRSHDVAINNKPYKVDPAKMKAIDDRGKSIALRRISKTEDNLVVPDMWEDMDKQLVKVVDLKPTMNEYQMVKSMFMRTCVKFKIEKIQRIQNPYKWQAYQIKKQEMDARTGNNNEKLLFHGTASTTVGLINTSGFNRSYAGLHAAVYGNGTYFAVDARYSAQDGYSKPDAQGKKYMYLARVLVGDYCHGESGLVVPKAKNKSDPTNLYDSVADSIRSPSIFVIFNDIQAYPEYLITFKK